MNRTNTKHLSCDELRKLIRIRKKQIAFDSYPKQLQDYLTRTGMNPYKDDVDNHIEYRDFNFTVKEN